MCRNITTLRGLQPAATEEEIEAAAVQYVRKVSGVQKPSVRTEEAFAEAVRRVARRDEGAAGRPPRTAAAPSHAPAAAADRGARRLITPLSAAALSVTS